MPRTAQIDLKNGETEIRIALTIDGSGSSTIDTKIPFFDHMLTLFARHILIDLLVEADGDIEVDQLETRWTFTPKDPWRAGTYHLLALDILEDLAGNQIGRAFEVDNFESVDKSPNPQTLTIPFAVK